ncbi:MAG: hypothetical protein KJ838_01425, partial [Candidatus Omnitrophica bacterium]|nr:hypothetical protein [Candidatus Omnitrophota bacterium]
MYYRDMYEFLAKVNFSTPESLGVSGDKYQEKIEELVDGKFEYIVGFQPYGREKLRIKDAEEKIARGENLSAQEKTNYEKAKYRVNDISYLMKRFKHFKIAYLGDLKNPDVAKGESGWYGALLEYRDYSQDDAEAKGEKVEYGFEDGGVIIESRRIYFPVHYLFGQGKPMNQNNMLKFARGEIVGFMDMNQDMYFEETFKGPCLAEEFRNDPNVVIAGFPEDIVTDDATYVGKMHAFADRTFNSIVQRTLNWMGVRFHYGHPDYIRADAIRHLGLIIPPYVNEDIFGAYKATLHGKKVINKEIMQAGKAREGTFSGLLGIHSKFAGGGWEQGMSRWLYRLNNSSLFGFERAFMHFVGAIGFYLRKPWVVFTVTSYLTLVLLMGISAFVSLPSELIFGIVAIYMSQAITFTGYFQLVLERGLLKGTWDFIKMFPGLMISFGSQPYDAYFPGAIEAASGGAKYVGTGRIWGRQHELPFSTEPTPQPAKGGSGELYQYIAQRQLTWIITNILMIGFGIWLLQSWGIIWSFFFITMPFSALMAPFLFNPGSTPWNVGLKNWKKIYWNDLKNGIKKLWFITQDTSVKLANLPGGLKFPDSIKTKVGYDSNRQLLLFRNRMSTENRNILLSLSSDKNYQNAVNALFRKSHTWWLRNALIVAIFGSFTLGVGILTASVPYGILIFTISYFASKPFRNFINLLISEIVVFGGLFIISIFAGILNSLKSCFHKETETPPPAPEEEKPEEVAAAPSIYPYGYGYGPYGRGIEFAQPRTYAVDQTIY